MKTSEHCLEEKAETAGQHLCQYISHLQKRCSYETITGSFNNNWIVDTVNHYWNQKCRIC